MLPLLFPGVLLKPMKASPRNYKGRSDIKKAEKAQALLAAAVRSGPAHLQRDVFRVGLALVAKCYPDNSFSRRSRFSRPESIRADDRFRPDHLHIVG